MIVEPRLVGTVCLTSHPEGCTQGVLNEIEYVKKQGKLDMPKKVLVIGGSTGYGLATRISAAFAGDADTICVSFERVPKEKKAGTPGYYNNIAFKKEAEKAGLKAININGDAFSDEIREETIAAIKENLGKVDLVVYSLASPFRTDPKTGESYKSVIKPIGPAYSAKSVNFLTKKVEIVEIEPAKEEEIEPTVKVMGGEDWTLWIDALEKAGVLAEGVKTCAFSYIGPKVTHDVYTNGTIGAAKAHLAKTADELNERLKSSYNGEAFVSVNKAVATRASAMIPVVPLYISILFKIMKAKGTHEDCIEQMDRMLRDKVYGKAGLIVDEKRLVRMDDWEMDADVQAEVARLWDLIEDGNISELTDIESFRRSYLQLHGFEMDGIDYSKETSFVVE